MRHVALALLQCNGGGGGGIPFRVADSFLPRHRAATRCKYAPLTKLPAL